MRDLTQLAAPLRESAGNLAQGVAIAQRSARDAITPYWRNLRAAYDDAGRYLEPIGDEIGSTTRTLLDRAMQRDTLRNRLIVAALTVGACWIVVRRIRRKRKQRAAAKPARAQTAKPRRRTPAKRKSNASGEVASAQVH
jgi:hypothetical protein